MQYPDRIIDFVNTLEFMGYVVLDRKRSREIAVNKLRNLNENFTSSVLRTIINKKNEKINKHSDLCA